MPVSPSWYLRVAAQAGTRPAWAHAVCRRARQGFPFRFNSLTLILRHERFTADSYNYHFRNELLAFERVLEVNYRRFIEAIRMI